MREAMAARLPRTKGPPMILLDLFCGAGGAGMGYHRAGFDVVGVDIAPQPAYPFGFHQQDALFVLHCLLHNGGSTFTHPDGRAEFLTLSDFAAVHASPPCQRFSTMTADPERHPDLIGTVRELLIESGLLYIIENVPQAPLVNPVTLCGSAFGLRVRRHRAFESSAPLTGTGHFHAEQGRPVGVYGQHPDRRQYLRPDGTERGTKATSLGHGQRAMGIDWMTWPELAESIPPAFTQWIGAQLLDVLRGDVSTPPGSSREHIHGTDASPGRRTGSHLNTDAPAGSASSEHSRQSVSAGTASCSSASNRGRDVQV